MPKKLFHAHRKESSKEIPSDIVFIRKGYVVQKNHICISYKWDGYGSNPPMAASELDYVIPNFLEFYMISDVVLVGKISQLFFQQFPEQKNDYYPSLSFTVCSNEGFEERLQTIDTKVQNFLEEARCLCRTYVPQEANRPWLQKSTV